MSRLRLTLLALPGVSLGLAGLVHPGSLSYATSERWWMLHVPGLLVFPLVGVALMALVWGRRDPLALVVYAAAFVYATFYSALDVVSGIGAGWVTYRLGPDQPRPDEVRSLFEIGGRLGDVGEWGLIVAAAAVSAHVALRAGLLAVPGGVLVLAGAYGIYTDHIFSPVGAAGAAATGIGTAALGWASARSASSHTPVRSASR